MDAIIYVNNLINMADFFGFSDNYLRFLKRNGGIFVYFYSKIRDNADKTTGSGWWDGKRW